MYTETIQLQAGRDEMRVRSEKAKKHLLPVK